MHHRSGFLEGLVLGAILGVVGGILFAPTAGEETRKKIKKIKEDNEELIEKTKGAIEDGFQKLVAMVDERKKNKKTENL